MEMLIKELADGITTAEHEEETAQKAYEKVSCADVCVLLPFKILLLFPNFPRLVQLLSIRPSVCESQDQCLSPQRFPFMFANISRAFI